MALNCSAGRTTASATEAPPWTPPPARGLQRGLAATALFLVFFRAYMIAPLVRALAALGAVWATTVGRGEG